MKRSDITDLSVVAACCAAHQAGEAQAVKMIDPTVGDGGRFSVDYLRDLYPEAPDKVLLVAMERAHDRGFIEYGITLRSAWVTEEGLNLLNEGE